MGRDIYLYYSMDEKGIFILEGWRVNPPADWIDTEKKQYTTLNIGPFATLAENYFNKATEVRDNPDLDSADKVEGINQNLTKAREYTKLITSLDPTNVDANRFLVQLYESQGKTEEALGEIGNLVKKEPDNKFYLAQYGEIFMRLNKYDEAIREYQKALKIDPDFCDVLRNIAAAYKNKAVAIVQKQQDKKIEDKNYEENPDEYRPLLLESEKYFKKSRSCQKYRNDLNVLSELANLYNALEMKDELDDIVVSLERLEHAIADDEKEVYWLKMCKILSDMKSPKADRACEEAKKF
jgi:tetratricopeptide (TPR) repeat protein